MNLTFIIKASPSIGYGHLIRSRTLARDLTGLMKKADSLHYYVIGDPQLAGLLSGEPFPFEVFESESDLLAQRTKLCFDDFVAFDMLSVEDDLYDEVRGRASSLVSISPVFNRLTDVDLFFHRSKYHSSSFGPNTDVHKGLDYALIQASCARIRAASFKEHLYDDKLSIAVSMGGGDAANQSLATLAALNDLKKDCTIWLMLGEGYSHSYDDLIAESRKSHHEIILAKTLSSMWKVLGLSSLLILPGGVTTYEAAYSGLPVLNIVRDPSQRFLIQELLELGVGDEVPAVDDGELVTRVEHFEQNRDLLYEMHLNSKGVIDGHAGERIFDVLMATSRTR
jgi:spore coat polysaccharide biosynthesis predicted glycosyltransferase SpsG